MASVYSLNKMQKITGGLSGVLVFCFWYFIYHYHIVNQESFSLFLDTPDFFFGLGTKPGGWSEYAGLFIVQYFRYAMLGAFIQTLSFLAVFYLVSTFMRRYQVFEKWFALAWLPSILLLALQSHYDFLFGNTLKVLLYFGLFFLYTALNNPRIRFICFSAGSPLILLMCGSGIFTWLYITILVFELFSNPTRKLSLYKLITLVCITLLLPQFWRYVYLTSQTQLYALFPDIISFNVPHVPVFIFLYLPLLILGAKLEGLLKLPLRQPLRLSLNLIILAGLLWQFKAQCYYPNVELQLRQENAISQKNWDEALAAAEGYTGGRHAIIHMTNLALAQKGKLAEKFFEYPQIGLEGLIPSKANDYYSYLYAYEIYAALGQTNEAFRYLFEASVCKFSNPPARAYKNLAELLIKLEKYEAAKRYLYLLLHTQRFRQWAKVTLKGLPDKGFGKTHPSPTKEDYIMGIDVISDLYYMAQHSPGNSKIQDYLLMGLLLEKRLPEFYRCFSEYYRPGRPIPKIYQEALTIVDAAHLDPEVFNKYPVSADCKNRFAAYQVAADKKTYWFYYQHYNPNPEN